MPGECRINFVSKAIVMYYQLNQVIPLQIQGIRRATCPFVQVRIIRICLKVVVSSSKCTFVSKDSVTL